MVEQPHVLHAIRDNVIRLREQVDKRIDVALDFHGRCTPAMVTFFKLSYFYLVNNNYFSSLDV